MQEQYNSTGDIDKKNPKISVIIPVYNVENYIEETLLAITNQTYNNLEIVIVNDGTPDNSMDIVAKFAQSDDRFVIINKENGGVSDARNAGLKAATGEFIGWIDPDDVPVDTMYEEMMSAALEKDADMVISDFYHWYPERKKNNAKIAKVTKELAALQYYGNKEILEYTYSGKFRNILCNKLHKKELYNDVKFTKGLIYEGTSTHHQLISKAKRFAVVNKPLYYYRREREGSYLSENTPQKIIDFFKVNHEVYNQFPEKYKTVKKNMYDKLLNRYLIIGIEDRKRNPEIKKLLLEDMNKYYSFIKRFRIKKLVKYNVLSTRYVSKPLNYIKRFFVTIFNPLTYLKIIIFIMNIVKNILLFTIDIFIRPKKTLERLIRFSATIFKTIATTRVGMIFFSILPKSKKRLIFFPSVNAWDNQVAVYNELIKNGLHNEYKIVWLVNKRLFPKAHQIKYGKAVKMQSAKSYWLFYRSKYIFTTHSLLTYFVARGQKRVQLWHGGVPIKLRSPYTPQGAVKPDSFGFLKSCRTDIAITSSEWFKDDVANTFHVENSKVMTTGIPKTDDMFVEYNLRKELNIPWASKLFLWMPTWRNSKRYASTVGIPSLFGLPLIDLENANNLNEFLKKNNCVIFYKTHPADSSSKKLPDWSNIIDANQILDDDLTLYKLAGNIDVFLTDYSNIGNDFLAVNKPIAYVWDDFNVYESERGFHFDDPKQYMPGPYIDTFEGLLNFIEKSTQNIDEYEEDRKRVNKLFNDFNDGKSAYRVLKELKIIK